MEGAQVKEMLRGRIEAVTEPGFLQARLRPYLPELDDSLVTEVVQLDGTGAATVEVRGGTGSVFAKFFPNGSGPAIHDKLRTFRDNGFGSRSRYQVVEPLEWIPEYHLLLTRRAPGVAVAESIGVDDDATLSGVVEAATWLARLNTSPLRYGPPSSLLVSSEVLSVARRLAKVAAARPDYVRVAVEMIKRLEDLAETTVDGVSVQSHGQYRPIHVFVAQEAVTVIDLDRSRPCDPSRDVAEFLHRVRMRMFWDHGSVERAEEPTRAFLEAYRAQTPPEYTANLRFQWARYVFHSLTRKMKPGERGEDQLEPTLDFYRSEFDRLVEGSLGGPA